jgi:hypothetical protein
MSAPTPGGAAQWTFTIPQPELHRRLLLVHGHRDRRRQTATDHVELVLGQSSPPTLVTSATPAPSSSPRGSR